MSEAAKTGLWKHAFSPRKNDPHGEPRARLLGALERMRTNVGDLLKNVPADCKDLTIHDVTHLDALWDMASIIVGDDYDINPAEAFVLGAAILLHDAGLTVASYPRGLIDLKETIEWKDITASVLRQESIKISSETLSAPPERLIGYIKFAVLRALHAKQADKMATTSWSLPGGGEIYLLDDLELRQAFGSAIGRIAHSHNWDISKVAEDLVDNIGSGTVLPTEWSVGERKIACILRCADAAHIDRRRAPSILLAATKPQGISGTHWGAQNKINKPVVSKSTIMYTSGQPFKSSEAEAWWLVYDLISLVDREIKASNALLEEISAPPFKVQRVFGANSPRALSINIKPDQWRPIDAVVKVSDPVHLARTLGGRHLYGDDVLAPVKEMLQNAADAIRARCQLEDREISWGTIRLTIEPIANDPSACWVHVDDNGIGMTEKVLSGPLIDFGRSIWSSPLLQEEFPGLQSKNIAPIGKFGIGFFAVFELGSEIKVISKHYEAGLPDAKTLEFRSIATRPLIRPAEAKELPRDFSTRVSVKLTDYAKIQSYVSRRSSMSGRRRQDLVESFDKHLLRLVAMLDIRTEYNDKIAGTEFVHEPNSEKIDPITFIDEFLGDRSERIRERIKDVYALLLQPLVGEDGKYWGRAALAFADPIETSYEARRMSYVSVGGFTYDGALSVPIAYVGILVGDTDQAARQSAYPEVPKSVLKDWATQQAGLIQKNRFQKKELLKACELVIRLDGDPGDLPYCFHDGRLITYKVAIGIISRLDRLVIPLQIKYNKSLQVYGYNFLGADFFELKMHENVFVIQEHEGAIISEDMTQLIVKSGRKEISESDLDSGLSGSLQLLFKTVRDVWGGGARYFVEGASLFETDMYVPPSRFWTLNIRKTTNA